VRIELAACVDGERDAIERAVRIEVGEDAFALHDPSAVAVRVDCAPDGLDAGVVIEVRRPGNPRRYRYALDWHEQPLDARPRLIGLAVVEAVDASRIELTAVPEPPLAPGGGPRAQVATPRARSDWSIALIGAQRSFSARAGVDLLGGGLMPSRRLSSHVQLAGDLLVEGATMLSETGTVSVRSVSAAPWLVVRAGGRVHAELGLGARIGVVVMRGEALPGSHLAGESFARVWLGPAASAALGIDVHPSLALSARLELGQAAAGAAARDLGEPIAAIGGTWTSFGVAAAIAL
jgi:hypothetical protein